MNSEKKVMVRRNVVIVGNGVAGSQLAAALSKIDKYNVSVITPFPYQEASVSMTSVVATGPQHHEHALFPLVKEDNVTYVIGTCTELRSGAAIVSNNQEVPFDVCVVCVGQRIPIYFPNPQVDTSIEARKQTISSVYDSVRRARSIVISGGGPIGVETAADIKLRFKEKEVTIVQSHSQVLNKMAAPFSSLAVKELEKMGVNVILNDRVVREDNGRVELKSGKTLSCDYFIAASATGGNGGSFLPVNAVDNKGYVKVTNTLEIENLPGVFALGDCSNTDAPKTFGAIQDQLPTIVANIELYLNNNNTDPTKSNRSVPLKPHVKSFVGQFTGPVLVALGHDVDGAFGLGPDCPGCFCSTFCWCCCFFGGPCSTPAGPKVAQAKADFNKTIMPQKGKGMSR